MKRGFSESIYIREEKKEILKRIKRFDKLYLEIGGKLLLDFHASRVLPGYKSRTKLNLLKQLGDIDIVYCINASDLENKRVIHDFDLTADLHAIKNIKSLKKFGLSVSAVAINLYCGQKGVHKFKKQIEKMGIPVYIRSKLSGYPKNLKKVVEGFKKETYIPLNKKLTIVTGVASNSGKMGFALNQIYHEREQGINTGFAKVETFPIWNLPLNHPINLAYEAATADLLDINMIDPYHKKEYGINAVNYNRDIENFSILKQISRVVSKKQAFGYKSPTDMGINMAKSAIINDLVCREAAKKEIIQRYKQYFEDYKKGHESKSTIKRMREIISKLILYS